MKLLQPVVDQTDQLIGYNHWCPGCKQKHFIPTRQYRQPKPNPAWTFNGDLSKPTFNPSVRVFIPAHEWDGVKYPEKTLCHYFIRNGELDFCGDSAHQFAGRLIPMEGVVTMAENQSGGNTGGGGDKKSTGLMRPNPNRADSGLPKPGSEAAEKSEIVVGKSQEILDAEAKGESADKEQLNEAANEALDAAKEKLAEGTRLEAYGKHGSQDENNPLTMPEELDAIDKGAVALSQQAGANLTRGLSSSQLAGIADLPEDSKTFSSHPIQRFKLGRFQFDRGTLTLSGDDLSEFEKLLNSDKLPARDRNVVKEIDRESAERAAQRFLDTKRVRGVDTAGVRNNLRGNN